MVISNTYFLKKDIYKATWRSPDGITENQIDRRHVIDILYVRSNRETLDHYMIKVKRRQRLANYKENGERQILNFVHCLDKKKLPE
ncbi:hypothetical protein CEXT_344061 [Caerostris extrusa]|uniref:Uncharacterized protein n=1 Tax=Caerostris extrusa TaxID=172846 RepID=A0AAV4Y9E4_CAEEX|nr:hypothetical protein CEXT_344061 [Caerostris extrusa]